MSAKRKIKYFQIALLQWFSTNGRRFPWRRQNLSQYQLIIAEVLLQRTKAETVSKFYLNFIKQFPGWKSLAQAGKDALAEQLKPIGLQQQRAKRLHDLAIEMVKRNGRLPKKRTELEQIPFLGQYIINAIELMIFKQSSPLLDVNMSRVLERYFGERKLADIRYDPYLQNLARIVVDIDIEESKRLNWAILDFAALVCKASNPLCLMCPLNAKCLYFNSKRKL